MNERINFKVNEDLCNACGICASDCVTGIIEMNPTPQIPIEKEERCIRCQHCMAVCPKGAISIFGKNPSDSIPNAKELPSPALMEKLIKNRRSIRRYKKEGVDKNLIHHLLETAAYAPTGENDNHVLFTVIDDIEVMAQLREITYNAIAKAGEEGKITDKLSFIYEFAKLWKEPGVDVIFRGAPHIVITSSPEDCATPSQDMVIALSYFEMLAISNGLGTLWDGIFTLALLYIAPQLRQFLGIPENHTIGFAMLFGKPAIKYARSIQSEGIFINTVQAK